MSGLSLIESAISGARGRVSQRDGVARPLEDFDSGYLLGLAALVAAYYGSAHLGYAFRFAGPVAAIVWLPTGVGIAFLYLGGLALWPGVLIGDLIVNNYSALPVGSAIGQSVGNVLEIVVAVVILRRLKPTGQPLATVPGLAVVIAGIAAGCAVSATVGVLALALGGVIHTSGLRVWRTWWLGDFTGALIVVPLALAWWRASSPAWVRGRVPEGTLLLVTVAALSQLGLNTRSPLNYLVFPGLIWAALRFGPRGATLAITIVAGFTVWSTTHYHGPFVFHSVTRSVLSAQLYIAVAAISTLTLTAISCERRALARRLRASRARLIGAADIERRRLERDLHDGAQQRLVTLGAHLGLAAIEARAQPAHAGALFESAGAELQLAIDELRALAQGIRPPVLSQFGLTSAIRTIAGNSSIPIEVVDGPTVRFDDRAESTAYFVVVEAIANAQKHSRASQILVRFDALPGTLCVEVRDDGIGGAAELSGLGLEGLRDRVEGVGGSLAVHSRVGRGTRIVASIPTTTRPPGT
jgi:signal transduction histidine kinase